MSSGAGSWICPNFSVFISKLLSFCADGTGVIAEVELEGFSLGGVMPESQFHIGAHFITAAEDEPVSLAACRKEPQKHTCISILVHTSGIHKAAHINIGEQRVGEEVTKETFRQFHSLLQREPTGYSCLLYTSDAADEL